MIAVTERDGIAIVTLAHGKANALDAEFCAALTKAFVKLKEGAPPLTLDALKAFLAERLGKHEMVQALELRAELPKTPVGKLSKKELYAEEEARRRAATP